MQSEKQFKKVLQRTGDELLIVDCGHENTASPYRESQRRTNIQFAAEWANRENRCFPLGLSDNLYDVCSLGDRVVPITLDDSMIQWDIWEEYAGGRASDIIARFIQSMKMSIESTGERALQYLADTIIKQYAAAQKEQARCPVLKAVYQTVREMVIYMIQDLHVDGQWQETLILACDQGIELLEQYLNVPADEFIEMQFAYCMEVLTDDKTFIFCEVTKEFTSSKGRAVVFYDKEYLYCRLNKTGEYT